MYSPKKCGIKYTPPTLVLIYEDYVMHKTKRRSIPLRGLTYNSDPQEIARSLYDNPSHSPYLKRITRTQIEGLVGRVIRQLAEHHPRRLPELPLTSTPTSSKMLGHDQDLNRLGDMDLNREKEKMNTLFEKNKISQDDQNYEYDIEMDFADGAKLESGWDSGDEIDF